MKSAFVPIMLGTIVVLGTSVALLHKPQIDKMMKSVGCSMKEMGCQMTEKFKDQNESNCSCGN